MFDAEFFQRAIIAAPAILFALTIHEYSHAWTALKFGDPTAKNLGRLSLNPLVHLDFFGTLMMFLSGFRFGWAKPVPVNPMNLRNPRVADIWISAAGPLSNIGLAIIFGGIFQISVNLFEHIPEGILSFLFYSVMINVSLAFFNMIPLFPLDGSHILRNLAPRKYLNDIEKFERFAPFILLIIIMTGTAWVFLGPFVVFFVNLFMGQTIL